MNLYTKDQEEKVYLCKKAKSWHRSNFISKDQLDQFEVLADPKLNQTNFFFRLLLFGFTLLCSFSIIGFFVWVFGIRSEWSLALTLAVYAVPIYFMAERGVRTHSLYHHGIEEALAIGAMILLCFSAAFVLDEIGISNRWERALLCGTISLTFYWVFRRFGLLYPLFISILALCFIPDQFFVSHMGVRALIILILIICLYGSHTVGQDHHELYLKSRHVIIDACLLAGIYLVINLQITEVASFTHKLRDKISPGVYWGTYVLTFLWPALLITFGIKKRKRVWIDVGLLTAVISLMTNKSYLELKRYEWDPAILGILLIGVAVFFLRWFAKDKNKTRFGFTSRSLLKPETHGIDLASLGVVAMGTQAGLTPHEPSPQGPDVGGGGESGGGGASRSF